MTARARDRDLEPIEHEHAVRQVGQRIMLARARKFAERGCGGFGNRVRVERGEHQMPVGFVQGAAWRRIAHQPAHFRQVLAQANELGDEAVGIVAEAGEVRTVRHR